MFPLCGFIVPSSTAVKNLCQSCITSGEISSQSPFHRKSWGWEGGVEIIILLLLSLLVLLQKLLASMEKVSLSFVVLVWSPVQSRCPSAHSVLGVCSSHPSALSESSNHQKFSDCEIISCIPCPPSSHQSISERHEFSFRGSNSVNPQRLSWFLLRCVRIFWLPHIDDLCWMSLVAAAAATTAGGGGTQRVTIFSVASFDPPNCPVLLFRWPGLSIRCVNYYDPISWFIWRVTP